MWTGQWCRPVGVAEQQSRWCLGPAWHDQGGSWARECRTFPPFWVCRAGGWEAGVSRYSLGQNQQERTTEPLIEAGAIDVPANRIAWLQRRESRVWAVLTSRRPHLYYCKHTVMAAYNTLRIVFVLTRVIIVGRGTLVRLVVELEASQTSKKWSRTLLLPNTRQAQRVNTLDSCHEEQFLDHPDPPSLYLTASLSPSNEAAGVRCRKTTPRPRRAIFHVEACCVTAFAIGITAPCRFNLAMAHVG